jgi:hypothetical protein
MAEPKTKATKESVKDFLSKVEPEEKRQDSFTLLEMFEKITGEKGVMWGTSIVGFGQYHYFTSDPAGQIHCYFKRDFITSYGVFPARARCGRS